MSMRPLRHLPWLLAITAGVATAAVTGVTDDIVIRDPAPNDDTWANIPTVDYGTPVPTPYIEVFDEKQCVQVSFCPEPDPSEENTICVTKWGSCHLVRATSSKDTPIANGGGEITFDEPILGVFDTPYSLAMSDGDCGLEMPTEYPGNVPGRGLEAGDPLDPAFDPANEGDSYEISNKTLIIHSLNSSLEQSDQLRVVTRCTPGGGPGGGGND